MQPTKFQRIRQDPRYADLLKKYACRHKAIKRAKHPGRQDRTGLTRHSAKCLIESDDRDIDISLAFGDRVLRLKLSTLSVQQ